MPALFFSGRKVESSAALFALMKQKWIGILRSGFPRFSFEIMSRYRLISFTRR